MLLSVVLQLIVTFVTFCCQLIKSPGAGNLYYTTFVGVEIVTNFLGQHSAVIPNFLAVIEVSKITDNQGISVESSRQPRLSEQIFHRKYSLGAPANLQKAD